MYLGHGSGVDDIAIMVGVIIVGLMLLRRSERSVRTRAQEADGQAPAEETVVPDPFDGDAPPS
ncbi:MAG: hypothetical protein OEY55_03925 [Acidimicrobiia bacterium]|nr:hypothetical protein [Acidimicrobiia bacterium]